MSNQITLLHLQKTTALRTASNSVSKHDESGSHTTIFWLLALGIWFYFCMHLKFLTRPGQPDQGHTEAKGLRPRLRPNLWDQGRRRCRSFKAEAKILASKQLWPQGLNISEGQYSYRNCIGCSASSLATAGLSC